jgi:hypothetical protein
VLPPASGVYAGGCLLSSVELGGSSESVFREIFQVKFCKINHYQSLLFVFYLKSRLIIKY